MDKYGNVFYIYLTKDLLCFHLCFLYLERRIYETLETTTEELTIKEIKGKSTLELD
jgi:hypothetical protein